LSYRDAASFPQIAAVAVLAGPLASLATLSFEPLWVSLMTIAGLAFLAMTTLASRRRSIPFRSSQGDDQGAGAARICRSTPTSSRCIARDACCQGYRT
jgi:hypothetical protein